VLYICILSSSRLRRKRKKS